MQTTAIGTVANSLPENEVFLLTLLISKGYILFAELLNKAAIFRNFQPGIPPAFSAQPIPIATFFAYLRGGMWRCPGYHTINIPSESYSDK